MDFDGNPKGYGDLRPTDHTEQSTFAGHVFRIVDDKTDKVRHYFVAPKSPGKVILRD